MVRPMPEVPADYPRYDPALPRSDDLRSAMTSIRPSTLNASPIRLRSRATTRPGTGCGFRASELLTLIGHATAEHLDNRADDRTSRISAPARP